LVEVEVVSLCCLSMDRIGPAPIGDDVVQGQWWRR
jgi:hypothetical protein